MGSTGPGQTAEASADARVAEVFRLECARIVASVLHVVRDIDAAEEVAQEAFGQALDDIDASALASYHLPAARGDFLRRLAGWREAAAEYRRALALVDNPRERSFLVGRLAECEAGRG